MLLKTACKAAAILLATGVTTGAWADGHTRSALVVAEEFEGTVISFEIREAPKGLRNLTLTVSGPNEFSATYFSDDAALKIDLRDYGRPFDGAYRYDITAATGARIEINTPIDENGRAGTARNQVLVPVSVDGNFVIRDGEIVSVDKDEKEDG